MSKTTLLVVDDLVMDRRLAGGLLEKHEDWTVLYASDGKQALEQVERYQPDVVLTDMQMPEMNGLELVEAVKKNFPLVPVILMTALGSEEIAVQALQRGAASYVAKNKLATELIDTVEQVLHTRSEECATVRLLECITESDYEFVLENDLGLLFSLVGFLREAIERMGGHEQNEQLRLGIALEEALLNAYYHGNLEVKSELREIDHQAYFDLAKQRTQEPPYCDRRIFVRARISKKGVTYVIRDEGPGFDHSKIPDPTDPANIDRPCGRGLLLMRTFLDGVSYNERGNEVTLVKRHAPCQAHCTVEETCS